MFRGHLPCSSFLTALCKQVRDDMGRKRPFYPSFFRASAYHPADVF